MSKLKTHFEIWIQPPCESDSEGYSEIYCGREDIEHATTIIGVVDCKNCLKRLAQDQRIKESDDDL